MRTISAGIEGHSRLPRGDGAVLLEPLLQPYLARMPRAAAEEGLLAGEFHAHRTPGLLREQRAQELGLEEILLCAEPAAHVIDEHAHLGERESEHLGKTAAHHEGRL